MVYSTTLSFKKDKSMIIGTYFKFTLKSAISLLLWPKCKVMMVFII